MKKVLVIYDWEDFIAELKLAIVGGHIFRDIKRLLAKHEVKHGSYFLFVGARNKGDD